ncbi:MAG: SAM-dependent methyltransferase [Deltaproteobacteria bacterium]|nr:SAM-dependent methyltransferase [Deltaproteobacteria bacterium]
MKFDRKNHWAKVYNEKSPKSVSWYQDQPNLSLELILSTKVASDEAIIDVGGGASILVDNLIKGYFTNLAVLDISKKALSITKKRLGDSAKNIDWFESDITKFDSPKQYALWHDRALFHFLTDTFDRKNYIKVLNNALKTEGHLIIATFDMGGPERCSGLKIVHYNSEKMIAELGDNFKLIKERTEKHITPAKQTQNFKFFHFLKI